MNIDRFDGEYAFLSNFYPATVRYCYEVYPTVEHAYQAAKTLDEERRTVIRNVPADKPGLTKRLGNAKGTVIRSDWEEVKVGIMTNLVRRKFRIPELRRMLLLTGQAKLIEGNWWGDKFWGVCKGEGLNHLGRILMAERDRICSLNNKDYNDKYMMTKSWGE